MTKVLQKLHDEVEDLGYKPGTVDFDKKLVELKVERCKEMHGVFVCTDCKAYGNCPLVQEYMLDLRFPNRRNPT